MIFGIRKLFFSYNLNHFKKNRFFLIKAKRLLVRYMGLFSMFDAMKGLKEALAAKERLPEPRKELAQDAAEELNRALCSLEVGMFITVVYYCQYQEEYCQITGAVSKIDLYWKMLYVDNIGIDFEEIALLNVTEGLAKPM
jgi:hypothetical protein